LTLKVGKKKGKKKKGRTSPASRRKAKKGKALRYFPFTETSRPATTEKEKKRRGERGGGGRKKAEKGEGRIRRLTSILSRLFPYSMGR